MAANILNRLYISIYFCYKLIADIFIICRLFIKCLTSIHTVNINGSCVKGGSISIGLEPLLFLFVCRMETTNREQVEPPIFSITSYSSWVVDTTRETTLRIEWPDETPHWGLRPPSSLLCSRDGVWGLHLRRPHSDVKTWQGHGELGSTFFPFNHFECSHTLDQSWSLDMISHVQHDHSYLKIINTAWMKSRV